jgi:hypothetical protein
MIDFDRILAVKQQARAQLLALPGVHSVGIGAKRVGGERTSEPAIVVYVVKKRPLAELAPAETVPPEIDGIKTDVVEEEMPRLLALPDTDRYPILDGGIQIQAGTTLNGLGTLGCFAVPKDGRPIVYAITNQHVVALGVAKEGDLQFWLSENSRQLIFSGKNIANALISVDLLLRPTGGGNLQYVPGRYTTTAADTLSTIASNVATAINNFGNPAVSATPQADGEVTIAPAFGFALETICRISPLWMNVSVNQITVTGRNVEGSVVVVDLNVMQTGGIAAGLDYYVIYATTASDKLTTIAANIASNLTALAIPGITVTPPAGTQVTIGSTSGYTATVTGADVYAPRQEDPHSRLKATVDASHTSFTLTGRVSSGNYGIYTNVNVGGGAGSDGGFVAVGKDADPTSIASSLVNPISSLVPRSVVSSAGSKVTVTKVEELECEVASDVRVGQPDNGCFDSKCSACCDHRIGRVVDARLVVDVALIQLDPKLKYKNAIEEIGFITGTYDVKPDDVMLPNTYRLRKRGRTTGLTYGTLEAIYVDGDTAGDDVFHRRYTGALKIKSLPNAAPFCDRGDSGSAVVNDLPGVVEVVGILFAGNPDNTYAMPIGYIQNLFNIKVAVTPPPGFVEVVPDIPAAASAFSAAAVPERVVMRSAGPAGSNGLSRDRLRQAEEEICATPLGQQYATLVRRHMVEAQQLINTNRRVATVWHRSGGPQLVQALLRMLQDRDQPLAREINGKPLVDCLQNIQDILLRHASAPFSADLKRYAPGLRQFAGLTYDQLLAVLQSASVV